MSSPNYPPVPCPFCGHRVIDATITPEEPAVSCPNCCRSWGAHSTPNMSGPDYEAAYPEADTPELTDEFIALFFQQQLLAAPGASQDRGADEATREFLLRDAAARDRDAHCHELQWLREPFTLESLTNAQALADMAAGALRTHDLLTRGAFVGGVLGPCADEWSVAGGPRAYVRQEYQAWQDSLLAEQEQEQEQEQERHEVLPHRDAVGEIVDVHGRPL